MKPIKTLADFCEQSNLDADLIRATVKQFGGWSSFKESASDVANHGIDGGFHGFIYNADTEPFARRNRKLIAALAKQQANGWQRCGRRIAHPERSCLVCR